MSGCSPLRVAEKLSAISGQLSAKKRVFAVFSGLKKADR